MRFATSLFQNTANSLRLPLVFLFLTVLCVGENVHADFNHLHALNANRGYEPALISVIESIEKQNLTQALTRIDAHLVRFPSSREGHLLRADILQAMSGRLSGLGQHKLIEPENLTDFKHQLKNRLKHQGQEGSNAHRLIPSNLIDIGQHKHVIVADMSNGRLYLYKNNKGSPLLVRDYYLTIGAEGYGKEVEGDNRTPVGVYEINRYIEGKALPDLYGKGAFPVNYPNRYDRSLKRTGYGIWLHGTPSSTYARSPWASEGCFVLSNDDLLDIAKYISVEDRTPVVLTDDLEWLDDEQYAARKESYMTVINQWKDDWERLDVDAYLSHYSKDNFNLGTQNYTAWAKRKKSVNKAKTFVQLDLDFQSLFVYPGREDMFVVKFKQRYLSNNYSGESAKEQYWQRDSSGKWRIIYEG